MDGNISICICRECCDKLMVLSKKWTPPFSYVLFCYWTCIQISIPSDRVVEVAEKLLQIQDEALKMAGLGVRDILRIEAGLCLYGNDINESTTPIEAGLSWCISESSVKSNACAIYRVFWCAFLFRFLNASALVSSISIALAQLILKCFGTT